MASFSERRQNLRANYSTQRRSKASGFRHKYKGRFNALDEGIDHFHRYRVTSLDQLDKGIRNNLRKNGVYKITVVLNGQSYSYVGSSVGFPTGSGGIGIRWAEHMADIGLARSYMQEVNLDEALPYFSGQFVHQAVAAVLLSGQGEVYFEILSLVRGDWINAEERTMIDREGSMIEKTGFNIREEKHRYRWSTFNKFVVGSQRFVIGRQWERLLVATVKYLVDSGMATSVGAIFEYLIKAKVFPPDFFSSQDNINYIIKYMHEFMQSLHSVSDGIARGILYASSDADALIKRYQKVSPMYNSDRAKNLLRSMYSVYAEQLEILKQDKRVVSGTYISDKGTLENIVDATALGLTWEELFTKAESVDIIDTTKETAARPTRRSVEEKNYFDKIKRKKLKELMGKTIKTGK